MFNFSNKASDSFKGHFVDETIRTSPSQIGSTMALIIATTTYEYGHLSSILPAEQLEMLVDLLEIKPGVSALFLSMTQY